MLFNCNELNTFNKAVTEGNNYGFNNMMIKIRKKEMYSFYWPWSFLYCCNVHWEWWGSQNIVRAFNSRPNEHTQMQFNVWWSIPLIMIMILHYRVSLCGGCACWSVAVTSLFSIIDSSTWACQESVLQVQQAKYIHTYTVIHSSIALLSREARTGK